MFRCAAGVVALWLVAATGSAQFGASTGKRGGADPAASSDTADDGQPPTETPEAAETPAPDDGPEAPAGPAGPATTADGTGAPTAPPPAAAPAPTPPQDTQKATSVAVQPEAGVGDDTATEGAAAGGGEDGAAPPDTDGPEITVAEPPPAPTFEEALEEAPPFERRGGFTAGFNLGYLVGAADGFPAEYDKRNVDEYAIDTGAALALGFNLFTGTTLTDWFSFTIGYAGVVLEGKDDLTAMSGAFYVRIESYPLYFLGDVWRDFGVATNFGFANVIVERGGKEQASGLGASMVGLGLFHESVQFGSFAMGPALEYAYAGTSNIETHSLLAALRFVYRTDPG